MSQFKKAIQCVNTDYVPQFRAFDGEKVVYPNGDLFGESKTSLAQVLTDEEWIPMQYIGKKDKAGKLLFEADIVKINNANVLFYIRRIDDRFALVDISEISKKSSLGLAFPIPDSKNIEKVGDVFSNVELLG